MRKNYNKLFQGSVFCLSNTGDSPRAFARAAPVGLFFITLRQSLAKLLRQPLNLQSSCLSLPVVTSVCHFTFSIFIFIKTEIKMEELPYILKISKKLKSWTSSLYGHWANTLCRNQTGLYVIRRLYKLNYISRQKQFAWDAS